MIMSLQNQTAPYNAGLCVYLESTARISCSQGASFNFKPPIKCVKGAWPLMLGHICTYLIDKGNEGKVTKEEKVTKSPSPKTKQLWKRNHSSRNEYSSLWHFCCSGYYLPNRPLICAVLAHSKTAPECPLAPKSGLFLCFKTAWKAGRRPVQLWGKRLMTSFVIGNSDTLDFPNLKFVSWYVIIGW